MVLSGKSDDDTEIFYLVLTTMAYLQNDVVLSFMLTYLQRHKDFLRTVVFKNVQYGFHR